MTALSDPILTSTSPLEPSELGDANALVAEAGWNQVEADWKIFLDLGRVYAVRNSENKVIATAATLPHGGQFAWISMVLVNGAYRRKGIATRLLRQCIDDLTARDVVPVLDATPEGREVYRALGFQDVWSYQRLLLTTPATTVTFTRDEDLDVRTVEATKWATICDYDASAFGTSRALMLSRLRRRLPGAELYAMRRGKITGLLLGRNGRTANQLGPLIAEDDATALAFLAHALSVVKPPVYIDLADAKGDVRKWLESIGFAPLRPLTRMLLGRNTRFDDPTRTYAVAGPEFG